MLHYYFFLIEVTIEKAHIDQIFYPETFRLKIRKAIARSLEKPQKAV